MPVFTSNVLLNRLLASCLRAKKGHATVHPYVP